MLLQNLRGVNENAAIVRPRFSHVMRAYEQKTDGTGKRKAALEAEHKAELAKLDTRLKKEKNRLGRIERNDDTRRKVLAGATVLQWAAKDDDFAARLRAELQAFLVRSSDRALFGLPPIEEKKE